ncbi:MAG: Histone transcription regulator 3 [Chrysothrix sp. TS-e1954]|nr:MAG: Histone transcription regulator 3 [Chrysothrix sp. TS-e1954]
MSCNMPLRFANRMRQASFKALNVESDDESDEEIDNTKEIQIEEALKVYQNALKFHSQRDALQEAAKEYENLFESEIFKLPEAQSEYNRVEALQGQYEDEDLYLQDAADVQEVVQTAPDNAPNTLPQILHLSYKNRGEHHLDLLKDLLRKRDILPGDHLNYDDKEEIHANASKALQDFAEALDKDEDDLDLWRRAARIAEVLGHTRISRFCLEAALEGDLDTSDDILGRPSFDAEFGAQELRKLEVKLDDQVSMHQPPLSNLQPKELPSVLKDSLSLYPTIPKMPVAVDQEEGIQQRQTLVAPARDWETLGQAILDALQARDQGLSTTNGIVIRINVPIETDRGAKSEQHDNAITTIADSVETLQSPVDSEKLSPIASKPSAIDAGTFDQEPATGSALLHEDSAAKITLPNRKRTTDAAELTETADGERGRSKRIRARESTINKRATGEAEKPIATSRDDSKLEMIYEADQWLHEVTDSIYRVLDLGPVEHPKFLREYVRSEPESGDGTSTSIMLGQALRDLRGAMKSWKQAKTLLVTRKERKDGPATGPHNPGLLDFLEDSNDTRRTDSACSPSSNIETFVTHVNHNQMTLIEVALLWLQSLLSRFDASVNHVTTPISCYERELWTDGVKHVLEEIVLHIEEPLHQYITRVKDKILERPTDHGDIVDYPLLQGLLDYIQSLFEVHLDIYCRMANVATPLDQEAQLRRKIWLERWSDCSQSVIADLTGLLGSGSLEQAPVITRHLWCTVFCLRAFNDVSREHLIACIEDLKLHLVNTSSKEIRLPNSIVMPEISVAAADKEKSKLETMDFFLSIFKANQHPADLIEKLEPILQPSNVADGSFDEGGRTQQTSEKSDEVSEEQLALKPVMSTSSVAVLSDFLGKASIPLRLTLLRRLRDAYEEIDYSPKIFAINFVIIELLMSNLKTTAYTNLGSEERERVLLQTLSELDVLLTSCSNIVESSSRAFDFHDHAGLRVIAQTLTDASTVLYMVSMYDDYSLLSPKGVSLANPFRTYPSESFHPASLRFHEMQLRVATLRYRIFQEATMQLGTVTFAQDADLLSYLRNVHHALGMRRLCKASDSFFLQFMRRELLSIANEDTDTSDDLAQILYDLYDIQCFSSLAKRQDHGCDADYLDRTEAYDLTELVLKKAHNVGVTVLLKSDLGKTIEKLHQATAKPLNSHAIVQNRKILATAMKAAINPLDLYESLKGIGALPVSATSSPEATLASNGWYYLIGHLSLAKYKAARARNTAGPTEELQNAITTFGHDLECSTEKWETWFRLAQTHDSLIEEQVLWSAEKLNTNVQELAQAQRTAIHAYAMACANAVRSVQSTEETKMTLSELYTDFGMRMYSSSCSPFSMEAFSLEEFGDKICSGPAAIGGNGLYRKKPFRGMQAYQVWKFASVLFRRAIALNGKGWLSHYMLAKCLWKLHQTAEDHQSSTGPSQEDVLDSFMGAVEALPSRKEAGNKDPIFEPISKIVSVVHKLVKRGGIMTAAASEILKHLLKRQKQFDAAKVPELESADGWDGFILEIWMMLRNADKKNWHHRIVAHIAGLKYQMAGKTAEAAQIAKDFMIERNNLYSARSMALSVWKPEHERAGRHWVYMTRYARFLGRILEQTKDLDGMQALARRVRKKPNEYFAHADLWTYICGAHVRMHRRHARIPERMEEHVFRNLSLEDIGSNLTKMDLWIASPDNRHKLLDVLREALELKKLNHNMVKANFIDDLIADTYAAMYESVEPTLKDLVPPKVAEKPAPAKPNIMALNHLMNSDGVTGSNSLISQGANQSEVTAKPLRFKQVSRREILRRAAEAVTVATTPAKPPGSSSRTPARQATTGQEQSNAKQVTPTEGGARSSIKEDDDSELSELESDTDMGPEDIMATSRRLFPNLNTNGDLVGSSNDSERDDEQNDGDDEGEDQSDSDGVPDAADPDSDRRHEGWAVDNNNEAASDPARVETGMESAAGVAMELD